MTIELRPLGVACQMSCGYCYQEPQRLANGNKGSKYDFDAMIAEVERVGQEFSLFGGEIMLLPLKELERFFEYGFKKFGRNGLQSNGALITDEHIELFKKYNVNVGISIDGANELNSLRTVRGKEDDEKQTLANTQKIMDNIIKVRQAGVSVSIIITLHKLNGIGDKLERLINFIKWLGDNGVTQGNIHVLEVDKTMRDGDKWVLTQKENIEAFYRLMDFFAENPRLHYAPFDEFEKLLMGDDERSLCYWNMCNPLDTQAVYGIEGNGGLSNCGRTAKEGIDWYKSGSGGSFGRYISFYHTPEELGGCHGCRFWMICSGSCPGEAMDGDFRNKTTNCATQKALLGKAERKLVKEGKQPITLSPLRPVMENIILDSITNNRQISLRHMLEILNSQKKETIQVPVISNWEGEAIDGTTEL